MTRKYSPEERAVALELLDRNGGNIAPTAVMSGVPQRTLYTWRQEHWLQQLQQRKITPPPPPSSLPTFPDEIARMDYLRNQIMDEVLRITESFKDVQTTMTPHQRALIVSYLLDRLMKLDQHLKPYRPQPIERHYVRGSEGEEPDGRTDTARTPHPSEGNS